MYFPQFVTVAERTAIQSPGNAMPQRKHRANYYAVWCVKSRLVPVVSGTVILDMNVLDITIDASHGRAARGVEIMKSRYPIRTSLVLAGATMDLIITHYQRVSEWSLASLVDGYVEMASVSQDGGTGSRLPRTEILVIAVRMGCCFWSCLSERQRTLPGDRHGTGKSQFTMANIAAAQVTSQGTNSIASIHYISAEQPNSLTA